jgi:hypothetical protein
MVALTGRKPKSIFSGRPRHHNPAAASRQQLSALTTPSPGTSDPPIYPAPSCSMSSRNCSMV